MDSLVAGGASRSRRPSARRPRETRTSRSALPSSGRRSLALPGFGGSQPRLGEKRGQRLVARLRTPLLDVHARGHLVDAVDVAADVLDDLADVRRSDENGTRIREHLLAPTPRAPAARASSTRAPTRAPSRSTASQTRDRPRPRAARGCRARGRPAGALARRPRSPPPRHRAPRASSPGAARRDSPRSGRARRPGAVPPTSGRTTVAPPTS